MRARGGAWEMLGRISVAGAPPPKTGLEDTRPSVFTDAWCLGGGN